MCLEPSGTVPVDWDLLLFFVGGLIVVFVAQLLHGATSAGCAAARVGGDCRRFECIATAEATCRHMYKQAVSACVWCTSCCWLDCIAVTCWCFLVVACPSSMH
jgi:hypothetical protein